MTAQQALEQEGWIVFGADTEQRIGSVVINERGAGCMVPLGAAMVITGELSRVEALAFCNCVNWRLSDTDTHFYKAVAE